MVLGTLHPKEPLIRGNFLPFLSSPASSLLAAAAGFPPSDPNLSPEEEDGQQAAG